MKTIELDTKILNKNLEMTRISKQLDDLTSDYVALKEQCREQTPMHMLNTLEDCYTAIKNHTLGTETTLLKDLRNVIKFLRQ
jgi:hypothetical protein